ncbi:hypothetical protein [Prescottella equi]|uniref:hypothetical protein n=1 Tax=Rhodococcus hoagii TaxID=43767 RepID=UPI00350E522D
MRRAVPGGELPASLTLVPPAGVLSGTSTVTGRFEFTDTASCGIGNGADFGSVSPNPRHGSRPDPSGLRIVSRGVVIL